MTSVDQLGTLGIKLDAGDDVTVSTSLSNINATATDADLYIVGTAIVGLLDYPVVSFTRNEKTLLNA